MFNILKKNKTSSGAYIFIGRSGSGKGTQVELFRKELEKRSNSKILHIETGAFFREYIKGGSYTEKLSKQVVETGGLMPEAIVVGLWVDYLNKNYTGKENIVCDGAPRKLHEADLLDGMFNFLEITKYKVIHINTSVKWCTERLLARGRRDDTEEGIAKRMHWYDTEVMKTINFFENSKNCRLIEVNGEQTIEQVHAELVSKVFEK
ncbi:MAG: nucleoside monophosphate kinase [bacterium]